MSFKKYVISMIICAVTIFVMIGSIFIPIKSYASIGLEQEFSKYWTSWGVDTGIPRLPSYYQNCVGWSSCVNNWNKFCSYNYANTFYYTYVNSNGSSSLRIYKYDYLVNQNYVGYIKFNSCVYANLSTSINSNGLEIVNVSLNLSGGSDTFTVSANPDVISSSSTKHYISFSGSGANTDNSYNDNNIDFFAKVKAFGSWLLNGVEDVGNLIIDGDYGKFFNELQDNNNRYLKNTLNTSDDEKVKEVIHAFLNGDLGDVLLGDGSHLSSDQITAISNTLNKMQEVYSSNVSVRYDNDTNNYYITPSTAYNNYTSKQITDYYNNYIAYNYNNTYNNYTVVDFSTTNSLLGEINANIINCHMMLNNINTSLNTSFTTSINNIFSTFEVDLKSIFNDFIFKLDTTINNNTSSGSDVDLTSVTTILTNIDTEIKNDFNALSGIISGAIGVAWADIKADLQLIIDGISFNFKLGDIIVGDSTSSDDDTSNNIKVKGLDHIFDDLKNSFDNSIGDLNLNFKRLFDDLNLNLDDFFKDIHITIDKDNTTDIPTENDDFWKKVRDIIVMKVPLYSQCVDLFEPATNTNYLSISNNNSLLEDNIQSNSLMLNSIDDGQLELDTPIVVDLFDGLVSIKQSADNSVVKLGVSLSTNFYGYHFDGFYIDLTYYYNNLRLKVSNFLLFVFYMLFAWSVIHRISRLFGGSVSNNDNV